jgi:hypothetical protein
MDFLSSERYFAAEYAHHNLDPLARDHRLVGLLELFEGELVGDDVVELELAAESRSSSIWYHVSNILRPLMPKDRAALEDHVRLMSNLIGGLKRCPGALRCRRCGGLLEALVNAGSAPDISRSTSAPSPGRPCGFADPALPRGSKALRRAQASSRVRGAWG